MCISTIYRRNRVQFRRSLLFDVMDGVLKRIRWTLLVSFVSVAGVLKGFSCQINWLLVENARDRLVNVDFARTVYIYILAFLTNNIGARGPIG